MTGQSPERSSQVKVFRSRSVRLFGANEPQFPASKSSGKHVFNLLALSGAIRCERDQFILGGIGEFCPTENSNSNFVGSGGSADLSKATLAEAPSPHLRSRRSSEPIRPDVPPTR